MLIGTRDSERRGKEVNYMYIATCKVRKREGRRREGLLASYVL